MDYKDSIICLTRGYKNTDGYKDLIIRNVAIGQHINHGLSIPLLIFHEGNINFEHQIYIRDKSMGQHLLFVDISDVWAGGYEGMCKFNIYDIWAKCKELGIKYALRIDEDCSIKSITHNPFDQIKKDSSPYLKSVYWAESHSETNATFPPFLQSLTGIDPSAFYNDKYPYTNVGLADVDFMLSLPNLKEIAYNPLQRANRWGDLPVLGSLLNIYAKDKVGTLSGLSYYHISHNTTINC